MKSIVILFDEENKYENQAVFNGKSALEITESVLSEFSKDLVVIKRSECSTFTALLEKMVEVSKSADYVIYSYADVPFINKALTEQLVSDHLEYKAEYTFADGYPYGVSPEIIDSGLCKILLELSKSAQKEIGAGTVARDSFWNLLKTDINSFDVESVIADYDWRMLRLNLCCSQKENFSACKNLFESSEGKSEDVEELSKIASETVAVLKTVPAFYNIQIEDYISCDSIYSPYVKLYEEKFCKKPVAVNTRMSLDKFSELMKKIEKFSESGVIGLSCWGDPLKHPELIQIIELILKNSGFSVYLETEGTAVTDEFCSSLKSIVENAEERTNGWQKVMIAVSLDAFTSGKYKEIKNIEAPFEEAVAAVSKLEAAIPGNVYPRFIRMNQNEDELEAFYRYWSDKANESKGEVIIQKFNDYCGELPDSKPADLSPLERNVCWQLRRSLTILSNGDVPFCRQYGFKNIIGNAFSDSLEEIWNKLDSAVKDHLNKNYKDKCGKCDEFYIYEF